MMAWLQVLAALLSVALGRPAQLRVAFAYAGKTSDLGWTWRHNQGRIDMHRRLLDLYPGLAVQTFYQEDVPAASPPACPAAFEAWARAGLDVVVGTAPGHQDCLAALAARYPATVWFQAAGSLSLPLSNWGIGTAKIYQALFLAGVAAGRETRTGRVGACLPVRTAETQSHLAAFALGVAHANASVEVVAAWTGHWAAPDRDRLTVRRLAAQGSDVVFHRCGSLGGVSEAAALGVRSIVFNSEYSVLVGESVLLSPHYNWGVLYLEVARLVVERRFAAAAPVDWTLGLDRDAVGLSPPSFLVSKGTVEALRAAEAAVRNGTLDPFCGSIRTNEGKVVGSPGGCLDRAALQTLGWEPWNVVDRGHYLLPTEACSPGEAAEWAAAAGQYTCTPCPAGSYSEARINDTQQAVMCVPCPANTYAPRNATRCSACPSGTAPNPGQDGCVAAPLDTSVLVAVVVGCLGGVLLLSLSVCGVRYAWKATADFRHLHRRFSNNNVAQECAEAIACLNLESVAWLRTCKNPNKIQQSFLQILEIMTMVRPYIPDHILCLYSPRQSAQRPVEVVADQQPPEVVAAVPWATVVPPGGPLEGSPAAVAPAEVAERQSGTLRQLISDLSSAMTRQSPLFTLRRHRSDTTVRTSARHQSPTERGSPSPTNAACSPRRVRKQFLSFRLQCTDRPTPATPVAATPGEVISRRCVYMAVGVAFPGAEAADGAMQHVAHVLGEALAIGKNFGATIDQVVCDKVTLHWGLVTTVAEAPLKATLAALEMVQIRACLPLPWRTRLRLHVYVVQGLCDAATVSAANHRFFVVGGPPLQLVADLVAGNHAAKCKCEILVCASVQQQAQYTVDCMPRCFVGDTLFWQPLKATNDAAAVDEWMYELHHLESSRADKWSSHSLYDVFHRAAQGGDRATLRLEVDRLREQFGPQMSPQDVASLELLLAGVTPPEGQTFLG